MIVRNMGNDGDTESQEVAVDITRAKTKKAKYFIVRSLKIVKKLKF